MGTWTDDDYLRFDIERGLAAVTIRGFKRALTEEDRQQIARTIADRPKRNWTLARKPGPELGLARNRRRQPGARDRARGQPCLTQV